MGMRGDGPNGKHQARRHQARPLGSFVMVGLIAVGVPITACSDEKSAEPIDAGSPSVPSEPSVDDSSAEENETTVASSPSQAAASVDEFTVPSSSDTATMPPDIVAGTYTTTFGTLVLEIERLEVGGEYLEDDATGRVVGVLEGDVVSGFWLQENSTEPCDEERDGTIYWGRIEFAFDDVGFTGSWSYCDDQLEARWDGQRIDEESGLPVGESVVVPVVTAPGVSADEVNEAACDLVAQLVTASFGLSERLESGGVDSAAIADEFERILSDEALVAAAESLANGSTDLAAISNAALSDIRELSSLDSLIELMGVLGNDC